MAVSPKPSVVDFLSPQERRSAIDMALEGGLDAAEIFKAVTANVWGPTERRKMIVDWGKRMKLDSSESLRIAQQAGLIPSSHPPQQKKKGKLPSKDPESTS
jgi:hypothetical protein